MTASSGADGPHLALVVLAAGASQRLGACKALVDLGGGPLDTPLSRLLSAGAALTRGEAPLVVTGADHAPIRAALPAGVECVYNARWREGRTGSVACAVAARRGRDLCLAPVDVPRVSRSVFGALERAWHAAGAPPAGWLAPCLEVGGERRYGHPVVLGHALAERLLTGEEEHPWRERPLSHLRRLAQPLLSVVVSENSVIEDLDTALDLERMRREGRGG